MSLYEHKIKSLNVQLELLTKENIAQHIKPTYTETLLIKENTEQLKTLISTIKGDIHYMKKTLIPTTVQGLKHETHVENIHKDTIYCLIELKE